METKKRTSTVWVEENIKAYGLAKDFITNKPEDQVSSLRALVKNDIIGIIVDMKQGKGFAVYAVFLGKEGYEYELLMELKTYNIDRCGFYRAIGYGLEIIPLGDQQWEPARNWIRDNIPNGIRINIKGWQTPETLIKEVQEDGIALVKEDDVNS